VSCSCARVRGARAPVDAAEARRPAQVLDVEAEQEAIEQRLQFLRVWQLVRGAEQRDEAIASGAPSLWKTRSFIAARRLFRMDEFALKTSSTNANCASGSLSVTTRA
jgi:hypothetical protein